MGDSAWVWSGQPVYSSATFKTPIKPLRWENHPVFSWATVDPVKSLATFRTPYGKNKH